MDKEDVLRERINSLIDNELLSVEMLQEATGIEKDSLEKFLFEKYSLKRRSAYQQTSGKPFLSAWSSITAMKRGEWKYSKLK